MGRVILLNSKVEWIFYFMTYIHEVFLRDSDFSAGLVKNGCNSESSASFLNNCISWMIQSLGLIEILNTLDILLIIINRYYDNIKTR